MGDKYAVLIAIEKYQDGKLRQVTYAEADAKEMSATLDQLGFKIQDQQVLVNEEATKARIDSRLRRMVERLCEEDELIIYYAGHGFNTADKNYLTCFDSEWADIVRTSIPLQDIFDFVRSSKSHRITIFLDCCHSGPVVRDEYRDMFGEMTDEDMRKFFMDTEYHFCFASCKTTEKSYPSEKLGHGIWTYHLIEALKGNAPGAIIRDGIITSDSLQNYLAKQVPLELRQTRADLVTQTPIAYGTKTKEFIVADVGPILKARRAVAQLDVKELKRVAFRSESNLRVKSLSGFIKRRHQVPDSVNSYTEDFLNKISSKELNAEIEKARQAIHTELKYTRKQIKIDQGEGVATIFTPDFSLEISLTLDVDDPSQAKLRWELVNITSPELITSEPFNRAFDRTFSIIEFEYSKPFNVTELIDSLEAVRDERIDLYYPSNSSTCRIEIENLDFTILVSANRILLKFQRAGSPKLLLDGFKQAQQLMYKEHKVALLPS